MGNLQESLTFENIIFRFTLLAAARRKSVRAVTHINYTLELYIMMSSCSYCSSKMWLSLENTLIFKFCICFILEIFLWLRVHWKYFCFVFLFSILLITSLQFISDLLLLVYLFILWVSRLKLRSLIWDLCSNLEWKILL